MLQVSSDLHNLQLLQSFQGTAWYSCDPIFMHGSKKTLKYSSTYYWMTLRCERNILERDVKLACIELIDIDTITDRHELYMWGKEEIYFISWRQPN